MPRSPDKIPPATTIRGFTATTIGALLPALVGGWIASALVARHRERIHDDGRVDDPFLLLSLLTLALVVALAAGWLSGRLAGRQEMGYGAIAGLVLLAAALAFGVRTEWQLPLWHELTILILLPLAAIGGAWLRSLQGKAEPLARAN